jgi:hypothetical protein
MTHFTENSDRRAEVPNGPPCPRCGETLVLLVEPGIAEFYCPRGHACGVAALLEKQALSARQALREALALWEARQKEIARLAEEARAEGEIQKLALWERRLLLINERLRTIRQALRRQA